MLLQAVSCATLVLWGSNRFLLSEVVPTGWNLTISCTSDNSGNVFTVSQISPSVTISAVDASNITCIFDNAQANQKNPVLIVPGIMASRLYEGGNRFWEPLSDSDVEALYLDEEGKSVRDDVVPESVIGTFDGPLIFNRKVYDAMLADLEKMKSEKVSFDYAAAPYDWRLSIPDILEEGRDERQ